MAVSVYEEMRAAQHELRNVMSKRAVGRVPLGTIPDPRGGGMSSMRAEERSSPHNAISPRPVENPSSRGEYFMSETGDDPYGGLGYGSDKELEDDYEIIPEDGGDDGELAADMELEPDMEFFDNLPEEEEAYPVVSPRMHSSGHKDLASTKFYDAYNNIHTRSKRKSSRGQQRRKAKSLFPTVQSSGYGKPTPQAKTRAAKKNLRYLHELYNVHFEKVEKIENMRREEDEARSRLGYNKKALRPEQARKAFDRIASYYNAEAVERKLSEEEAKGKAMAAGMLERTMKLNKSLKDELGAIDERHQVWKNMMDQNDHLNRVRMAALEAKEENEVRRRQMMKDDAITRDDIVRKHQHRRYLVKELERVDDGGKIEHRYTNPPLDIYVDGIPGLSENEMIPPKISVAVDRRRKTEARIQSIRKKEARWDQIVVPNSPFAEHRSTTLQCETDPDPHRLSYQALSPGPSVASFAPWRSRINLKELTAQVYVRLLEGDDKSMVDNLRNHLTLDVTQRLALDLNALQSLALCCTKGSSPHRSPKALTGFTCLMSGDELQTGIVPYLLSKDVMGVAVTRTGAKVHLVPPCAFSCAHLAGLAPRALEELQRGSGGVINPNCYLLAFVTHPFVQPTDDMGSQTFVRGSTPRAQQRQASPDPATLAVDVPPPG